MKIPESEKQKITATVKKITDEFRKTYKVKIVSFRGIDGSLRVIMGDEYVEVSISYTARQFEIIAYSIMRHYPGDLALYFGIYWQNQLSYLYSNYSKALKEKAIAVLDNNRYFKP